MNAATPPRDRATEPLADALRRAAADLAGHAPPPAVRTAVLARLAPRAQATGELATGGLSTGGLSTAGGAALHRPGWAPWTTAALVGVLLMVSTALLLRPPAGGNGAPLADTGWAADAALLGFLPAASAERWFGQAGGARAAPAWVVSAELPREQLVEFGLPFDPSRAADTVRAELLLRGNGEVMAVRLLGDEAR
jgi:hypothetical protein